MIIWGKFRFVVVGALLSVVCGNAVAEEDNITTPAADKVEVASTEQVELTVSDNDKLQLELAREISVGEQAFKLKALADSFADYPPDAVKALLEHGGETERLQRAVEALYAWRCAETDLKLIINAFVEEQADVFVEEQADAVLGELAAGELANVFLNGLANVFLEELVTHIKSRCRGIFTGTEPEPEPTADDIVYIEAPKADRSGRVIIRLEESPYLVAVGESFAIRQAQYKVIAIRYLSPSEIELRLETKSGTINLIKKI